MLHTFCNVQVLRYSSPSNGIKYQLIKPLVPSIYMWNWYKGQLSENRCSLHEWWYGSK